MYNIKLEEGQIFEVNYNTGHTYIYCDGKIIEITPQEYNIVANELPENRAKALREFRWNNN
jgi:hypothetical protein